MYVDIQKRTMNLTDQIDIAMADSPWKTNEQTQENMTSYDVNGSFEVEVTSYNQQLNMLSVDWIISVTIIVAMVISLFGNTLIIYFICSKNKSLTAHNIAMVSICAAAILVAIFVIPTHLVIATYPDRVRDQTPMFLCKLHTYVWYWCKTVTIYSICALICDLYSRAAQPTKSHLLSGRYVFCISFIWFFGAAYNIWEIIIKTSDYVSVTEPDGRNATIRRCMTLARFSYIKNRLLFSDIFIIYALPLATVCYMYGAMIHHIYCTSTSYFRQNNNIKKIMFSISLLLTFIMCQLPLEIMEAWGFYYGTDIYRLILARKIVEAMSLVQGVVNIAVYVTFSSELHFVLRRRQYARVSVRAGIPQIRVNGNDVVRTNSNGMEMSVLVTQGQV